MPIVRIDLSDRRSPGQRRAISDAVHEAFVESVGIPRGDRFHLVTTHPAAEIIADPGYLDIAREDVVYIQVTFVRGRSAELKQKFFRAVADHLERVGVRRQDVAIVLTENTVADYSWGNGEAQLLNLGPVPGTEPAA
ncbi:tautomerase family protein [Amycolatopsis sp.]|uniref:tautomerase family protein n=1 Tax=Amycolatopsis sp. TaxID=37632 RepID=UPI002C6A24F2|nr:tautomerase family protein [Amycolatopsis sp.]HVV14195.1 tautomerase family protein [Amycolatopsis sp.]